MNTELQKAIFDFMCGNKDFQTVNATMKEFRQYIYKPDGSYCIGGEQVSKFVIEIDKVLNS